MALTPDSTLDSTLEEKAMLSPVKIPAAEPSSEQAVKDGQAGQAGDPAPRHSIPAVELDAALAAKPLADDGTRALLQAGFWILLFGLLALAATKTIFGGIGIQGAHTNAGWLSLMFALMGVPFGLMLLLLGIAKWLRNRRLARRRG